MDGCLSLNLKDFLTLLIQGGMFCVAMIALETWRRQLQGTTKHTVALRIATEVKQLTYLFFESRSPLFESWEFPDAYNALSQQERTHEVEADAWAHAYLNRWKQLWPQVKKVARLRAKVGAVLGDETADAAEKAARVAMRLKSWMQQDVEQRRAGPDIVARWSDQAFVKEVRQSAALTHGTRTDKYSREFTAAADKLLALVRPYFK